MVSGMKKALLSGSVPTPDDIRKIGSNFVFEGPTDSSGPHLRAYGTVTGAKPTDVTTAVAAPEGDKVFELTTTVGIIPDDVMGLEVMAQLNHVMPGKFVSFPSPNHGTAALVYATRQPMSQATDESMKADFRDHALTKVMIEPITNDSMGIRFANPNASHREIRRVAMDLVNSRMELNDRLRGSVEEPKYFPRAMHNE